MLFYYLFAMFPKPNRTETRSSLDPSHPTDLFFVEVMGVPPPKTRPCQMTGDIMTLHPQSTALEKVIETIVILKQIMQVNKEQHLILIILIRRCSFCLANIFCITICFDPVQVVNGVDFDSLSDDARSLIKSLKGDTPLIKMDEVWRELQVR